MQILQPLRVFDPLRVPSAAHRRALAALAVNGCAVRVANCFVRVTK